MSNDDTATIYVLRYLPDVPLHMRKHAPTVGRFPSYEAAEDARRARDAANDLEVQRREVATP